MKITAAFVQDFKRIHHIKITPDGDKTLILIGGQNAQGKTSLLDALTVAFGGKGTIPADPVRHGADEAVIRVELDSGAVIVRRIDPDGDTKLEIKSAAGAKERAPQTILDKLIGLRFLDPLAFLKLTPKEQRSMLLKLIDRDGALADLEQKRERLFDKRTEVGREVTRAKGELSRLPDYADVPSRVDVASAAADRAKLGEQRRALDALHHAVESAEDVLERLLADSQARQAEVKKIDEQIEELQRRRGDAVQALGEISRRTPAAREELAACEKARADGEGTWKASAVRVTELDATLREADERNRAAFEVETANARRKAADDTVKKHEAGYNELTHTLEKIEAKKLKILAAAKLPVDNLNVSATGLVLNGAPFENASGSEQLRVALGLAIAASPQLEDVWIRDGALLDEESLALVEKHAAETGHRVWVERVGTSDNGAIIISDGKIANPKRG